MRFLLTFSSFFFLFFFFFFFFRSNSLSEVLKYTRCLEIHTFSRSKGRFRPEILTEALSCHDMYILVVQQCFVGQSDDTIENSSTRICILWTVLLRKWSVTEEKLQFRKWDFFMWDRPWKTAARDVVVCWGRLLSNEILELWIRHSQIYVMK